MENEKNNCWCCIYNSNNSTIRFRSWLYGHTRESIFYLSRAAKHDSF